MKTYNVQAYKRVLSRLSGPVGVRFFSKNNIPSDAKSHNQGLLFFSKFFLLVRLSCISNRMNTVGIFTRTLG